MKPKSIRVLIACLLVVVFLLAFFLGACSVSRVDATTNSSFTMSEPKYQSYYMVSVLTDNEYGVEYIVVSENSTGGNVCITPRLQK